MPGNRIIRRLAAVQVTVPDPAESATFLSSTFDFARRSGAQGVEHIATGGAYGVGPPGRELTLFPGAELAVAGVVWEVCSEDALGRVGERLASLGIDAERLDGDEFGGHGIRFAQPDGVPMECRLPGSIEREALPSSDVRPRRLGHVNLKMPAPPRAAEFFGDVLGLRLTEQLGEILFFLRVNADHHNVALRPAAGHAGVHHVAFELSGWDQIRVVCDHLVARGQVIEYGPGRHAPGHQLFVYVRDPSSGLRLELFADMAHIDDDESYRPIRKNASEMTSESRMRSLNTWGPQPPESFQQ